MAHEEDRHEFNRSLPLSRPAFASPRHWPTCQVFSVPLLGLLWTLHTQQNELLGRGHRSPSQEMSTGGASPGVFSFEPSAKPPAHTAGSILEQSDPALSFSVPLTPCPCFSDSKRNEIRTLHLGGISWDPPYLTERPNNLPLPFSLPLNRSLKW